MNLNLNKTNRLTNRLLNRLASSQNLTRVGVDVYINHVFCVYHHSRPKSTAQLRFPFLEWCLFRIAPFFQIKKNLKRIMVRDGICGESANGLKNGCRRGSVWVCQAGRSKNRCRHFKLILCCFWSIISPHTKFRPNSMKNAVRS